MGESYSEFQSQVIKRIYEVSPEGILVVDEKNIIVSHNHQFVEIWQIPQHILQKSSSASVIGLDDVTVLSSVLDKIKNQDSFVSRIKELYANPKLQDFCEIELLDGRTLERHSNVISNDEGLYLGRVWFFRDITYRKHIEAELQSNQQRLQLAIHSGQIGIWELNLQTHELLWDDTMLALYQTNREDFSGHYNAWLSRVHPEDRPLHENALRTAIIQKSEYHLEFRAITPDGEIINLKGNAQVISDINGEAIRLIGTSWNNNAYAIAQQQLQFAYNAINSSQSAFFWVDPAGDLFAINDYACANLGYSREELLGKPCWFIDPSLNQQAWLATWHELKKQKKLQHESIFQHRSGNLIPVEIICNYYRNEDKEYCFTFANDISDREQNALALKMESDKNAALLRNASDGIHILDYDGNILEASDSFCNMLGYTRAEIIGMNVSQWDAGFLTPEEQLDVVRRQFDTPLRSQFETRHRRKDGSIFDVEVSGHTVELNNNRVLFNSSRDISERKKTEKILQEREHYQRALLDGFPFMVWLKDENSKFLAVNHAFAEACGLSCPSELEGKTDYDIWPHDLASAYQADDKTVLASGVSKSVEEPIEINGKRIWFETYKSPVKIIGQVKGTIGFARDITERKQTEKALADSHNLLQTVINSVPVRVFWKDKNLHYLGCNPLFAHDAGMESPEDLIGKDDTEMAWKDQADLYRTDDQLILESGITKVAYEEPQTTPNGDKIWLRTSKAPLLNDAKEIIGILGIYEDITKQKLTELALKESELLMQTMLDNAPFLIWLKDCEGYYLKINRAFADVVALQDPQQIMGKTDFDLWPKELAEQYRADDKEVLLSKHRKFIKNEKIFDGHQSFWAETYKIPVFDLEQNLRGTLGFSHDITERKKAELELQIAATAFESQEGIMVCDANNNILKVNKAFTKITGYNLEDVIGKKPSILKSDIQDEQFYLALWNQIKTHDSWEGDIWNQRKNGEVFPGHLIITAIKDQSDTITHYVATLTDITQSKAATAEIERLAFYDSLTGLPNRRLLIDRLQQAIAASGRNHQNGALLFIDLDNFKNLNDALGHDIGDVLLQQVATRLSSCVRGSDTVARLGGDEFVVLLEYLGEQTLEAATQVEVIGKKILKTINQPYQLVDQAHITSASIGVTLFDQSHTSLEDLLKHADIAMYQSKKEGRNTLRFFDPQMQASLNARLTLETDLRIALTDQQFQLYYQPQVSHTGQYIGAEALIRWQHPKRGMITPIEFISVAEEASLILLIGDWVIEAACQQIKNWEKNSQTKQLQLAVNVSARQFRQANFISRITEILEYTRINPEKLKLELTESLFLEDIDDTIAKMMSLRKLGVQFSMDDFGTGYSSLSNLKKLPIQQLKIDQSFVHDIITDSDDAIIVQTIIAMAKNLQIEVIAEGVETEAQRSFLEQHDCLLYQGFLYSEPLPIEQFETLLQLDPFKNELDKSDY